jgi:predicted DNA-binding transcriptional regulator AlpA
MTVKELVELGGKSETTIYKLAKRLGRLPTIEEVKEERLPGRPKKYK